MTTPLSGTICHPKAGTCYDQHAHQIWRLWLKPFQRYLKGTNNFKWVTWRGHTPFRDSLSSVDWDLLCSKHVPNMKCLRLPATKKWKAMPNVKILSSSHPLGLLRGTTQGSSMARWKVHCRCPISDNWTFFANSHGWGTIKQNLSTLALSEGVGQFERKF